MTIILEDEGLNDFHPNSFYEKMFIEAPLPSVYRG